MRRPWFLGGSHDGQRIGFESDPLPSSVILDGEAYTLHGGRYIVSSRRRGSAFTATRKRELIDLVRDGETIQRAATVVGVSLGTVYRHRKTDEDFCRELQRVRTGIDLPPWRPTLADKLHGFTVIPLLGGRACGESFPLGPPKWVSAEGEKYTLGLNREGHLTYFADSLAAVVECDEDDGS